MAVFKIENFGGELPSVSPRALPADAAQTNRNLFLATREFRPLKADAPVASCEAGTKTLHRFARKPDGTFNSDPTTGWITSTDERSYVKGQINDERTERTYLTFDDGSARPRVIDASGADRLLGVPRPTKPTVAGVIKDEFTVEEASAFLLEVISTATKNSTTTVSQNSRAARLTPIPFNRPIAGPRIPGTDPGDTYFWQADDVGVPAPLNTHFWNMFFSVPNTRAAAIGLDFARHGVIQYQPTDVFVTLTALPYAFIPNKTTLVSQLTAVVRPAGAENAGQPLLTADEANSVADRIIEYLAPDLYAGTRRDELTSLFTEFREILYTSPAGSLSAAAVNDRVAAIRARALQLTGEIEQAGRARWEGVTANELVAAGMFNSAGGLNKLFKNLATRVVDSRFYVATFVTDWGEESAPSPPSDLLEIDQNDNVTVNRPALVTGETFAARNITKWRLYRSNTGAESSAFQFVDEISVAAATYTDTKKGAELGEVCPTITWAEPPYRADMQSASDPKPAVGTNPYLRGLVGMPNGIMAGFFDNTVAFCEPYHPYAWPVEYQITTEFPIVGLGVFGQTLFVGTTGNPYFISGADSASMSAIKLDSKQACASRRSIATVQGGVLYASPDGLCVADPNGVKVVSAAIYTREDWQRLQPQTMWAASHENIYYLFYQGQGGGCLTFDLSSGKLGRIQLSATAAFTDTVTDTLYVASNTSILAVFGGSTQRTGLWKSPKLTLPQQVPFAWLKVYGEQSVAVPAVVRWYADGVLRYTATVTSIEPVRLPPGRWLEHEIEVESAARITRVVVSGETKELQGV